MQQSEVFFCYYFAVDSCSFVVFVICCCLIICCIFILLFELVMCVCVSAHVERMKRKEMQEMPGKHAK